MVKVKSNSYFIKFYTLVNSKIDLMMISFSSSNKLFHSGAFHSFHLMSHALSTTGIDTLAVVLSPKIFGNSGCNVNETQILGSVHWKIY